MQITLLQTAPDIFLKSGIKLHDLSQCQAWRKEALSQAKGQRVLDEL